MAINTSLLHNEATEAVVVALTELYKSDDPDITGPDPDSLRGFAQAIAQIAVATAEHIVARAQTVQGGDSIQ